MRASLFCLMPPLLVGLLFPNLSFADPGPVVNVTDVASIALGEKRFNQNCVYCHGNAGSGGKGASLQNRDDLTPEYVFETIKNGKKRGALLMPAWQTSFSDKEIWELDAYVLSLRNITPKK